MSILVNAYQISKSFAARPLFQDLTFAIESGERIGLIGPNGAGKSTLLRIIASQMSPDDGKLSFQRGLRVGFLEQVPVFTEESAIISTILEGSSDPYDWENMVAAQELISKLHLDQFPEEYPVAMLSGGWKKRVALGRELIRAPDLLLLDEPTNHLDVESIVWLEGFLAKSQMATLTITHDRLFLQRISNRILELDSRNEGGLLSIQGDYATYLEVKEGLMQAQEKREVVLKNTLRRETEWLRRGAKARTTKQEARIQRAGKLKDDVQELSSRNQIRLLKMDFDATEKNPKKLIEVKQASKSYEGKEIFSGLDLLVAPGSRIGLLGQNGAGKSTLIRVLLGVEPPDAGSVIRAANLTIAYFDQARDTLDPSCSVMRTLCPTGDHVDYRGSHIHIRSYLDKFLFSKGQMDMAVGKLSGGEQSRLLLARLMLTQANVLVLDEPTNDLDMATLNILEECLIDFPGAVVLVTHDRYFLDQVANKIIAFPSVQTTGERKLVSFASYEQWEKWAEEAEDVQKQKAPARAPAEKKKKLSFKEQQELDAIGARIHEAEEKLTKVTSQSSASQLQAEIDQLYSRWTELEAKKA